MELSLSTLTLLPALTTAASCDYKLFSFGNPDISWPTSITYDVWADNVYDIAGRCAGIWANLQRFGVCLAPQNTYCGGIEETHILNWRFNIGVGCNEGMVESTWWEATRNEFGSIDCVQRD